MRSAFVPLCFLLVAGSTAHADPGTIDIETAMANAAAQHPVAREGSADVRAAEARVAVEHAHYYPDLEVFAQLDRTTTNTSNGVLFPEPGIPVVSGSAGRTFDAGVWARRSAPRRAGTCSAIVAGMRRSPRPIARRASCATTQR